MTRAEVNPRSMTPAPRMCEGGAGCDVLNMKTWLFGRQAWDEALFLLFGVPLGILWFTVLVTGWSVTLGLAITPFVILNLLVLAAVIRGAAWVEASLARSLLHIDVYPPHEPLVKQSLWRKTFGSCTWMPGPPAFDTTPIGTPVACSRRNASRLSGIGQRHSRPVRVRASRWAAMSTSASGTWIPCPRPCSQSWPGPWDS